MNSNNVYGIKNTEEFIKKYNKIISEECFLHVEIDRDFYNFLQLENYDYIMSTDLFPDLEIEYALVLYVIERYNMMYMPSDNMILLLSKNPNLILTTNNKEPIEVK